MSGGTGVTRRYDAAGANDDRRAIVCRGNHACIAVGDHGPTMMGTDAGVLQAVLQIAIVRSAPSQRFHRLR